MTPNQDHTPAWLDWLKKPENLMTGVVLAAALTQDRKPGQSRGDQVGESVLGSLAFRGGLDMNMQRRADQERQFQAQQQFQNRQLGQGDQRIALERSGQVQQAALTREQIAATRAEGQANRDQQTNMRNTPQAINPEERNLLRSQAGYYDRMPRDPSGGSGKDPNAPDAYEETMFKEWSTAKANAAMMSGQPYTLDPAEWLQYIQPYRNAKRVLTAMESNGLQGEVFKDDKGVWKVRAMGVRDPQNTEGGPGSVETGASPVVELSPLDTAVEAQRQRTQATAQRREAYQQSHAAPSEEEMMQFADRVNELSQQDLEALLKDPKVPMEQLRVIRKTLRDRRDRQQRQDRESRL